MSVTLEHVTRTVHGVPTSRGLLPQCVGGHQQRTPIARVLVKGEDVVLLDEPLAPLDYKLREELLAELPRSFDQSRPIFVYPTSQPHEALLLFGGTICMWQREV